MARGESVHLPICIRIHTLKTGNQCFCGFQLCTKGRAVVQAFSRRPLTTEARVRARVSPCELYGGKSGTGIVFLGVFGLYPVNIIPPLFSILIYHLGDEDRPIGSRSSET
jgi:hypothetical protein